MCADRKRLWALAGAVVFLGVAVACEDGTGPNVPPVSPGQSSVLVELQWEHPLPQGNHLYRMWGFSDGSFYAVGEAGTVLHFDGQAWTLLDTPVREDLHGIWASAPDNAYVAGFSGTVLHYDGLEWRTVATPATADLYAVWVNSPDDLFVAGTGGSVWNRFNGTWMEHEVAPGKRLRALLGYSHNEVYVSGSDASLFRYDGASWEAVTIGLTLSGDHEFLDMWGPGPGMFSFIVGQGAVWTDGVTWNAFPNSTFAQGLWGLSLNDQVMVGAGGSRHLVNGVTTIYPTPTLEPLYDVWGPANDDYFAVGRFGHTAHFNGVGWQALDSGPREDVRDVALSAVDAVAVGAAGLVMRRNGAAWTAESVAAAYDLWGVWQDDGLAVAVGRYTPDGRDWRQAILVEGGGSWSDAGVVGDAHRLFDVWGSAADDVHAVGWGGEIVHFDGIAWDIAAPCSGDAAFLRSVHGASADHVMAVGRTNDLRGLVCTFDGTAWTPRVLPGVEELWGVWVAGPTSAFAVGSLGAIRRFDGSTWSAMASPTSEQLFCVWGSSANDVYAAGWEGTLLHFNGSAWRRLLPATNRTVTAIAGRNPGDILFAGDGGAIWHFSGVQ